ncbi:MAG: hypothetical protein J5983_00210, partial [Ruminococcus sp.]|nr:hypothetical protein [Ruminococcus sp.]
MDKYEYKLKTEQMLELMSEGEYGKAAEVADTIDWKRVRNVTMLSNVSDIYEKNRDYQKSYEILNLAYHRAEGSRKIVSRLCTLALKTRNVDEAIDYYDDFVQIAPKDPNRYLLRYQILKAQRASLEQQIEALEEYKKAEYIEEWAFELAKLYQAAGMTAECLEECDDLILWFSEGKYVYQAMELKMKYKPLTPSQQEKYDKRNAKVSGDTEEIPTISGDTEEIPDVSGLTEKKEKPVEEEKEDKAEQSAENEKSAKAEPEIKVAEPVKEAMPAADEAPVPEVQIPGKKKKLGNTMKLDEALRALLHLGEPEKEEAAAEEVKEEEILPEEMEEENLDDLADAMLEIESVVDLGLAEEIQKEKMNKIIKVDPDLEELTVDSWDDEIEEDAVKVSEDIAVDIAEIIEADESEEAEAEEEEVYEEEAEAEEEEVYEEEAEAEEEEVYEEEAEAEEEEIYEEEAEAEE